jgi:proteasome lid subunit RPN8/RPN11
VGVFHTHGECPASPSKKDLEGMKAWPYAWIIACRGEVRAWIPFEGDAREIPVL